MIHFCPIFCTIVSKTRQSWFVMCRVNTGSNIFCFGRFLPFCLVFYTIVNKTRRVEDGWTENLLAGGRWRMNIFWCFVQHFLRSWARRDKAWGKKGHARLNFLNISSAWRAEVFGIKWIRMAKLVVKKFRKFFRNLFIFILVFSWIFSRPPKFI